MFASPMIKELNRSTFLLGSKNVIVGPNPRLLVVRLCTSQIVSDLQSNDHSFTVNYLVKSCGLSLDSAISVSKRVKFETPEKPDSVIRLLREYEFSDAHISKIVMKHPAFLVSNPEKTLLPKLEFLRSVGISSSNLSSIVSKNPDLLQRSLDKYLIPWYGTIKSVVDCEKKLLNVLKRSFWMNMNEWPRNLEVNVSVLRSIGMPRSCISYLLSAHPHTLCLEPDRFKQALDKVMEMGFDVSKYACAMAILVITKITPKLWKQKTEVFMRWGLPEDDVNLVFKRFPACMTLGEKKLEDTMDILVNKMGWKPEDVFRFPVVFSFSLEKWILPRCTVIKFLQLKGFIKEIPKLSSSIASSRKAFRSLFIVKYQKEIPQLSSIWDGETSFDELSISFHLTSSSEAS